MRSVLHALLASSLMLAFATDAAAEVAQAAMFRRGVIIAHWLGRNSGPNWPYGGDWFDEEDVRWVAAQGFDHLRVHVDGGQWIDAHGKLAEQPIEFFDRLRDWTGKHRLGVVLTMTGVPGRSDESPVDLSDERGRVDAGHLWRLIASRYVGVGDELRFEILDQPSVFGAAAGASASQVNDFQRSMLAAIREISPKRMVYLSPRGMILDHADTLDLTDSHTILSLEFFEPAAFTLQDLAPGRQGRPLTSFPGQIATVAEVESSIERISAWARKRPRPPKIYIAAFGVLRRADDASARTWIRTVSSAFERHGFSWAVYDYASGMAIRDRRTGEPTRILEALDLSAGY